MWSGIAIFTIAGRIRLTELVAQIKPQLESIKEFFDDFLTGSHVQIFPARLVLHVRFQRRCIEYFAACSPDTLGCPSYDVPDFRDGVSERIKTITNLLVVLDGTNIGTCGLDRHLFQGENPAVYGGRPIPPPRTTAGGRPGTQTLSTCPDVDATTGSAVSQARGDGPPPMRCSASPVDGLRPTRCDRSGAERSRDGTARFDRLGESHVEKPRDDDTLADGSTCGGAIGRSRPRDPPTPGETEPNRSDRVPCCGREAPPFTTGEDVTRIRSQIRSVLIITTMADLDLCNSYLNGYIRLKG